MDITGKGLDRAEQLGEQARKIIKRMQKRYTELDTFLENGWGASTVQKELQKIDRDWARLQPLLEEYMAIHAEYAAKTWGVGKK